MSTEGVAKRLDDHQAECHKSNLEVKATLAELRVQFSMLESDVRELKAAVTSLRKTLWW